MKLLLQVVAIVIGIGVVTAVVGHRLAGWPAGPDEPQVRGAVAAPAVPTATATGHCLDEAALRRVIREELASASAMVRASAAPEPVPAAIVPAAAQPAASSAPVSSPQQIGVVNRRIDDYIHAGVISESEMARLQSDIASLDPAARRAAMQRLVRALNSGALDGRL